MKQFLALLALGLLVCPAALAEKDPCATPGNNNDFLGIQTIRLWPGDAPQAKGKACEDTPTLTLFEPQRGHGNGSAVVVLPGGGYGGSRPTWRAGRWPTGSPRAAFAPSC